MHTECTTVLFIVQNEQEHCLLLALPCGRDPVDVHTQTQALKNSLIVYLTQKQAAGIINVQSQQVRLISRSHLPLSLSLSLSLSILLSLFSLLSHVCLFCSLFSSLLNLSVSPQGTHVLHIFPPCPFTQGHLSRVAPDLLSSASENCHLMIVVATV